MRRAFPLSCLLVALGCAGGSPPRTDGGNRCTTDLDCNDGHECTLDACGVDMTCRYTAVNERCTGGQTCEVGRGCVTSAECTTDMDCMDAHDCTIDTCVVGGICNHTPINERCTAPATCDPAMGCVGPMGCTSAGECNDDIACTIDTCAADMTCRNTPEDSLCTGTGEVCSATSGCFVPRPCTVDMDCDDGNFCNGREFCITEFGCQPPPAPASCADTDPCTINERCDTASDMCVTECNTAMGSCMCPTPMVTCSGRFRLPGASGDCFMLFNWDFSNVTFANDSGAIEITGWTVSTTGTVPPMADPGPACPNVNAVTTLGASGPGSCAETYRIQGTFTDDNTFTGTFSATFDGFCAGCSMSVPITGTRM
ncbi:MAG: hypothetical protein K8H88_33950 [Sandaracinaceae bacterium]|nr:hypothetical protein [Sandaracinaceae bacterium]